MLVLDNTGTTRVATFFSAVTLFFPAWEPTFHLGFSSLAFTREVTAHKTETFKVSFECRFGSLRPRKARVKATFAQPGGKTALGQDLALTPVKRAFFSTEISSVLVP